MGPATFRDHRGVWPQSSELALTRLMSPDPDSSWVQE
jgi:hypothetical protein